MTIIVNLAFICDLCDQIQAYADHTCDCDEIDIRLEDMVEGWHTVWADENNPDLVCNICFDKYKSLMKLEYAHIMGGNYFWITRPTPEKMP